MKLLYEDLEFWNTTTNRQFIHQAYEKAKKIVEDKHEPLIDWVESDYIDVQKGPPVLEVKKFKKFKQTKRTLKKKKPKKV